MATQLAIDWRHRTIYPHLYGLHKINVRPSAPRTRDLIFRTRVEGDGDGIISDDLAKELDRLVAGQGRVQYEFLHYDGELPQFSINPGSAVCVDCPDDALAIMREIAVTPSSFSLIVHRRSDDPAGD